MARHNNQSILKIEIPRYTLDQKLTFISIILQIITMLILCDVLELDNEIDPNFTILKN